MNKQPAALFVAALLAAAACGSSDEGALNSTAETATTEPVVASTDPMTAEDTTDDTLAEDGEADDEAEPVSASVRAPLTMTPGTAGPITVTPTECAVEGAALEGPDGGNDIAFAGERFFIHNDAGLLAFTFAGGADCTLTLDTAIGDGGVLSTDENGDHLSGTPSGRLLSSGVFNTMVYDVDQGLSYECDMGGDPVVTPDGTRALRGWGIPEVLEEWELTDTNCSQLGEVSFDGMVELRYWGVDGTDFLIGGENAAETVVVSRYRDGQALWTAGSDDTGAEDWWGWVHGMAPCGPYTCMIDTNTNALALIDEAGAVVAAFEVADLIGERGWVEPLLVGPDGAVYFMFDNAIDDENDVRANFTSIIRLDVTG